MNEDFCFIDSHPLEYHDNLHGNRLARIKKNTEPLLKNLGEKERKQWERDHAYQKTAVNSR